MIHSVLNCYPKWGPCNQRKVYLVISMHFRITSRVLVTFTCWSKGGRASLSPLTFLPASLTELCHDVCKRDTTPERSHSCKIRHWTKPKFKYPLVWGEFRAGFASDLCCHFQVNAYFHNKLLLPISPTRNVCVCMYIWLHAKRSIRTSVRNGC